MTRKNLLSTVGRTLRVASLFALAGATPAAAQYNHPTVNVYNPNVYSRTRQTMTDRAVARAALKIKRKSSSANNAPGSRPSTLPPSTRTPLVGSVTFKPVADQIAPRNMALALGDTPAEQKRLEGLFSEALEHYRGRLKQAGLPTNDVARAAAYLVTASYYAANDGVSLNDAQLDGLRKHLREFFSTDETFQRLSDRERQELFEDYGITATWIDSGYNIVKQAGDKEGVRQWRQMGRQNFMAVLGAPLEKVLITPDGVEYK